jgi:mannose-6-phosphate isomerase-like protein (cupin superfamily)
VKIKNFNNLELKDVSHNSEVKRQRFLNKGDIPALTNFSRAYFEQGQQVESHAHKDMHEVFYVLNGQAKMTIDEQEYFIEKDDAIWIELGEFHKIEALSPLEVLYFGIEELV